MKLLNRIVNSGLQTGPNLATSLLTILPRALQCRPLLPQTGQQIAVPGNQFDRKFLIMCGRSATCAATAAIAATSATAPVRDYAPSPKGSVFAIAPTYPTPPIKRKRV